MLGVYAVAQLPVDTTRFWPVKAPISCNHWSIRCDSSTLYERSDPADVTTEDVLAAGRQEINNPSLGPRGVGPFRYVENDVVTWIKAASGAPTVIVKFMR